MGRSSMRTAEAGIFEPHLPDDVSVRRWFALYALLFAGLAIPLVVAIKFDQFNVFATILGIFMIQLVILGDHLLAGVRGQ